ncbi:NAD(P)/FAD-dependent oxidoreductase [Chitinispirillales bacterium ANBcel5]|uniref:NAD(P)/FAD-dependent oxidoreductase n=1 Tax=Cellulosispirillum alkaliphilum TaxID=3039283 RepID=UPI002A5115D5|nr:NAD(P)/FAD-dependent oxidoreductase [Chitinispirillales bacterium ANBcel5]
MENYDIAVIGAGPAGAMAAFAAANGNKKVCLLERKEQAGIPVRCGEGVGLKGMSVTFEPQEQWIRNSITSAAMVSPSGIRVEIGDVETSYILDRVAMDGDLVKKAIKNGVHYKPSTAIISLNKDSDGKYLCTGPTVSLKASIVIIADGVESRLARCLGWNTALKASDIETCAFAKVVSPFIENSSCVFYTGKSISPGGYAWVFPRAKGEANVGLGISGSYSEAGKAQELLLSFIEQQFPQSRVSDVHCGGVPVAKWMKPLVKDGAMLVGDAARQVNCLNGAGIAYSLYAGNLAGTIASKAVTENGVDYSGLKFYEKEWKRRFGKQQQRSYSLKEFVHGCDDTFLDRIAKSLAREDPSKINYLRVFTTTFARNPILFFKAAKLFR